MKLAASNIALPAFNHAAELNYLPDMGLSGLEVAPSRVWKETGIGLTAQMVSQYRKIAEAAGLEVVGLHYLLFDQQHS